MSESLVIRLLGGSDAGWTAQWLLVDTAGGRLAAVARGTLADAAGFAATRRTIVLVPGTDVLLAEPVLPVKSGIKLAQVVPFALEEQLANDVEDMHFAVGKRGDRPGTPVAAVALPLMDEWLAALAAQRIAPDAIYAETSVLPAADSGVTLVVEGGRVYVRRPGRLGAVLDIEPLIDALQLAMAADGAIREEVTVYIAEEDYLHDQELIDGLREFTSGLQIKLLPEGALPLLALNAVAQGGINLLQGPYAVRSSLRSSLAPWRYAALLAGVLVAAHLGVTAAQAWQLSREEARLDQEITATYGQALPGAPAIDPADARRAIESRLAVLQAGGQASPLLESLSTLGEALAQVPDTRIDALSYRTNILDLRVLASSVDALDKIQHMAQERGMTAEIQSANPRDSKIEGRLQLKSPGA